jgi:thiol-disulfide isomerase/thioredoxin
VWQGTAVAARRAEVRYTAAMVPPVQPPQGPVRWRAIAAVAAVVLISALAWSAWRLASSARLPAASQAVKPPPSIPQNLLVTAPVPVPAPPLDLPTTDGRRFSLADARGQVVIVNFWATWCGPCVQELPSLVQLGRALAERHPGKFRILAVSVDEEPAAVARFFAKPAFGGVPPELVVALEPGAGPVTRAFHCQGRGACRPEDVRFPETYVVDQQGRIVAMVVGYIDWSTLGSMRFLEAVLAG